MRPCLSMLYPALRSLGSSHLCARSSSHFRRGFISNGNALLKRTPGFETDQGGYEHPQYHNQKNERSRKRPYTRSERANRRTTEPKAPQKPIKVVLPKLLPIPPMPSRIFQYPYLIGQLDLDRYLEPLYNNHWHATHSLQYHKLENGVLVPHTHKTVFLRKIYKFMTFNIALEFFGKAGALAIREYVSGFIPFNRCGAHLVVSHSARANNPHRRQRCTYPNLHSYRHHTKNHDDTFICSPTRHAHRPGHNIHRHPHRCLPRTAIRRSGVIPTGGETEKMA